MMIRGNCHCGNIAFTLAWDPDPTEIQARACGCTFCTKHSGVWTSNPNGRLQISVKDSSRVSKYAFGTKTADFHVCARCGIVPVATSRIDGRLYAVVNVNAFENIDRSVLHRVATNFDSESAESRLSRRTRSWIAEVEFIQGSN